MLEILVGEPSLLPGLPSQAVFHLVVSMFHCILFSWFSYDYQSLRPDIFLNSGERKENIICNICDRYNSLLGLLTTEVGDSFEFPARGKHR